MIILKISPAKDHRDRSLGFSSVEVSSTNDPDHVYIFTLEDGIPVTLHINEERDGYDGTFQSFDVTEVDTPPES